MCIFNKIFPGLHHELCLQQGEHWLLLGEDWP